MERSKNNWCWRCVLLCWCPACWCCCCCCCCSARSRSTSSSSLDADYCYYYLLLCFCFVFLFGRKHRFRRRSDHAVYFAVPLWFSFRHIFFFFWELLIVARVPNVESVKRDGRRAEINVENELSEMNEILLTEETTARDSIASAAASDYAHYAFKTFRLRSVFAKYYYFIIIISFLNLTVRFQWPHT